MTKQSTGNAYVSGTSIELRMWEYYVEYFVVLHFDFHPYAFELNDLDDW